MPEDAQYLDPRLVRLYDVLNPPDAASSFYAELVGPQPRRVLDLGCGTGQLARQLADAGHAVTAVDPAAPMLAIARHDARVTWVVGDARTLELPGRFDVAVMTGHAFQVLLTDADIAAVLGRARAHIVEGGWFAFETRNPLARRWERWTPEHSTRTVGDVTVSYELREVRGELVTFATHHAFPGETVTTESTLRFVGAASLVDRLRAAGFSRIELLGDWDGCAYSDAAPEIIARAWT